MLKFLNVLLLLVSVNGIAYPSGAGTCLVTADYSSITAMILRRRNLTNGPYVVTTNTSQYNQGTPVGITISGPSFIGIMFTVVDEFGQNVGTFAADGNVIHDCAGSNQTNPPSQAVTHGSNFNMTSYTLFWNPPANSVGKVYILGYVLKGIRGAPTTQEFFRFVRDDNSAVSLNAANGGVASGGVSSIPSLNNYSILIFAILLLLIGFFHSHKYFSLITIKIKNLMADRQR